MTVNECVIAWNAKRRTAAIDAVKDDKALEQAIKEEVARLTDATGQRTLSEHDHISRERHKALAAILAAAQEAA